MRWVGRALFVALFGGSVACSAVLGIEDLPGPKDAGASSSGGSSQFCATEQSARQHLYCADFDEGVATLWSGPTRQPNGLVVTDSAKARAEDGVLVCGDGGTVRLEAPTQGRPGLDIGFELKLEPSNVTFLRVVYSPAARGGTGEVHLSFRIEDRTTLVISIEKKGGASSPFTDRQKLDGVNTDATIRTRVEIKGDRFFTFSMEGVQMFSNTYEDLPTTAVPFDLVLGAVEGSANPAVRIDKLTIDAIP